MAGNRKGQALRIAVGITALVLLTVGGASAATPISACTTISAPGEYVLTQNIINSNASTCISITSSNVIFDGAGYSIDGTDNYSYGVYVYNHDSTLTDITVKNLVATDWYYAIEYQNTADGHILSTTANSNTIGIFLWGSSNNMLSDNTANLNNFTGIYIWTSSNSNTLTGNSANNNIWHGIAVQNHSNDNTLSNNIALNNEKNGFELYISRNNTLSNNNASYNKRGILVDPFNENNVLSNNIVSNNNEEGISFENSSNNFLNYNIVSNNNQGIRMTENSSYNTLKGNTLNLNNEYGIRLKNSSNNIIYNNYFNNTQNFGISNSINIWNITKTSGTNIVSSSYLGGNFWANPGGTGFSQTCADANSDVICDSPYTLNSNNIDYLPLARNPGTPSPTATVTPTSMFTPTPTPSSGNASSGTAIFGVNRDTVIKTTGNSITGGTHAATIQYYMQIFDYTGSQPLSNISFSSRLNTPITGWSNEEYASVNGGNANWIFPSTNSIKNNLEEVGVWYGTNISEMKSIGTDANININPTVFNSDGYQQINMTVRFSTISDANSMWVDMWISEYDEFNASFVPGSLYSDAPVGSYEFHPKGVEFEIDTEGIILNKPYNFSARIYVDINMTPVEFRPGINVGRNVGYSDVWNSNPGYSVIVPTSQLRSPLSYASAGTNLPLIWKTHTEDNILMEFEEIFELLAPNATSIVTPTPTVSPSPTTGGDVVSRYAGSDSIVQKSEAVQAVMDYFSSIITRQEAISVVMAYFTG